MLIASIIVGLIVLYLIFSYNNLIKVRNKVRESLRAIDIYLNQRFDVLTNMAETVVSYATHEKETLTKITELRNSIHQSDDEKVRTYNEIEKLVGGLTVQVENYPDLKASDNYIQLQKTMNDLEEKISASRRTYNANTTTFNTMIETIPTNLFAQMMGFSKKPLLEIDEHKKADINMKALLGNR
ncbi:LemA family protein [Caldalkalibacillus salinus]|uniref:LemA family protein n=1 Tax=Caldalkalibacillus salinus TaxID=2803787 RepID=UPI00192269B5|nr:LemA family protein [Caldalkalibacillus salinus]